MLLNNSTFESLFEIIAIESHQLKRKWIFLGTCKLATQIDNEFIETISNILNDHVHQYETMLIAGDFDMAIADLHLNNLMQPFENKYPYQHTNLLTVI